MTKWVFAVASVFIAAGMIFLAVGAGGAGSAGVGVGVLMYFGLAIDRIVRG